MEDDTPDSLAQSCGSPGPNSSLTETGRSSPITSPSSQGTFPSPRTSANHREQFSKDAADFLADLTNYLPLGCLSFEDLTEDGDDQEAGVWHEVTQLHLLHAFDGTVYSQLQRLTAAGWIRLWLTRSTANSNYLSFRIYILPFDVGRGFIDRQSKRLSSALEGIVPEIDISVNAWNGAFTPEQMCRFDPWASRDDGSLFWMFNKLPSPSPSPHLVKEKYTREALEDLLDPASILPGLKTELYPYQRRSAGLMLQRESISTLELDPCLEKRTAPDGSAFYFGARDLLFLRHPRYYEACKGGVLAETMGLGKTVMCLALILATKNHPPIVPAPFDLPPTRRSVASLADMAVSAINRKSVPWQVEFERIRLASGDIMERCRKKLEQEPASYEIPVEPMRWNRKTILPPPKKMMLAATTLIVVPRNLLQQWQLEVRKHVDEDVLRILVMENRKTPLPSPDELRSYDVVLFTRGRFEMEIKDGADDQGRRLGTTQLLCRCPYIGATRVRDCHCIRRDDLYDSPLKHLHFKRLIIDEGHFFSNTNTAAVSVANKLVTADHRWVVSGTPAKDLMGVEVDMSAAENMWHTPDTKDSRDAILDQRRHFSKKDDTNGAIRSLGGLASNFLKIKPWFAPDTTERKAEWEDYIYRHEDLRKKTFSGFSTCLRSTLKAMVVKTQPEDVEKDIELPPLSHEVVRLEPSFYDKLTANLFTLVLTANAVTSERTDMDYLFHKNSQKARSQLISNLRQSAFFWTGFSEADVLASLKSSNGYLEKANAGCTDADRELLVETLKCADAVLGSAGWKGLSRSHELGLFINEWPTESAEHWAFDSSTSPLLTGMSQLLEAQKYVNERMEQEDPGEGLGGAGIRALSQAREHATSKEQDDKQKLEKPILLKSGIPTSSIDGEPALKRRASLSSKGTKSSPMKSKPYKVVKSQKKRLNHATPAANFKSEDGAVIPEASQTAPAQPLAEGKDIRLPYESPFLRSRVVGTTSAKLSYLISQILKYYHHEKILVFYDGDNAAYYIAQMLELLHIKHEIYAKSLAAHLKSEYVVRFDQETQDRVLLMDVRNAAFGLNLPSASRIYFVNPICRPNVEAQAIKRAHRIGQTRKVFVETLVLKGTIEEKMLERSKRMTRAEHSDAKALEDDGGIREIIQSARVLQVHDCEKSGYGQMAALEEPQQLWSRPGWNHFSKANLTNSMTPPKKRKRSGESQDNEDDETSPSHDTFDGLTVRRKLAYVDCTGDSRSSKTEDSDDEPILARWRRRSSIDAPPPRKPDVDALDPNMKDLFLPQMSGFPEANGELLTTSQPPVITATPASHYRKLHIADLINDSPEPSPLQIRSDHSQLLQEIIRLL